MEPVSGQAYHRAMYQVTNQVGRLVEIAIWSPVLFEEAERWGREHDRVVDSVGQPYVCFVDLRGAKVFPPETVAAYLSTMKAEQQLVRTATLLPESALVALQINRMIREAGHPERRPFSNADELRHWLGEKLDEKERARLEQLLARPIHREL
ncbi:hypothetical protein NR798_14980 [Archangium gephyra]|uniref:hypothetical protein n=1 Tax=Archangium gephyra TaxID=48 RepID=UPI0035D5081F